MRTSECKKGVRVKILAKYIPGLPKRVEDEYKDCEGIIYADGCRTIVDVQAPHSVWSFSPRQLKKVE